MYMPITAVGVSNRFMGEPFDCAKPMGVRANYFPAQNSGAKFLFLSAG